MTHPEEKQRIRDRDERNGYIVLSIFALLLLAVGIILILLGYSSVAWRAQLLGYAISTMSNLATGLVSAGIIYYFLRKLFELKEVSGTTSETKVTQTAETLPVSPNTEQKQAAKSPADVSGIKENEYRVKLKAALEILIEQHGIEVTGLEIFRMSKMLDNAEINELSDKYWKSRNNKRDTK